MTIFNWITKYNISKVEILEDDVSFWYIGNNEPFSIYEYLDDSEISLDYERAFYPDDY